MIAEDVGSNDTILSSVLTWTLTVLVSNVSLPVIVITASPKDTAVITPSLLTVATELLFDEYVYVSSIYNQITL